MANKKESNLLEWSYSIGVGYCKQLGTASKRTHLCLNGILTTKLELTLIKKVFIKIVYQAVNGAKESQKQRVFGTEPSAR